jgi:RND superfamily putative drug exporter
MTGALYSLARFCARHRYLVVSAWLIVTVVLGPVGAPHQLGSATSDDLTLPGMGSQQATDTPQRRSPTRRTFQPRSHLHVSQGKLIDSGTLARRNRQGGLADGRARYVALVVNPLTS